MANLSVETVDLEDVERGGGDDEGDEVDETTSQSHVQGTLFQGGLRKGGGGGSCLKSFWEIEVFWGCLGKRLVEGLLGVFGKGCLGFGSVWGENGLFEGFLE